MTPGRLPAPGPTRSGASRPGAAVAAGLVGLLALGACGSGPSGSSGSTSTTSTSPATAAVHVTGPSVQQILHSTQVVVDGKSVAVPYQIGTRPVSPIYDTGQHVLITVGGLLPKELFSARTYPVVWTNLTDQPQQVVFEHLPVTSPVIPPGGTWTFTSVSAQSISYHTHSGMHGVVQIQTPGV